MGVFRIGVHQTLEGQKVMNVYHLAHSSQTAMSETQLQEFVDGVLDVVVANVSNTQTFEFIEYRRVDISGAGSALYVPTAWPATGAASGAALPSFCAFLISGVAAGQPKPRRFRKFIAGVLETDTSGSSFAASGDTRRTALADAHQDYNDGASDWKIASVSYKDFATGIIHDNVGSRWNLVDNFSSSDHVAIMGTRKIGRGN